MMSPSFPLKVDAGGLAPQPETSNTPVSPYLSSPDEVIATKSWWVWPGARTQALPPSPVLWPKPPPSLIGLALANSPSTACRKHDLIFFTLHLEEQTHRCSHITPIIAWLLHDVNRHRNESVNKIKVNNPYVSLITLINCHLEQIHLF